MDKLWGSGYTYIYIEVFEPLIADRGRNRDAASWAGARFSGISTDFSPKCSVRVLFLGG